MAKKTQRPKRLTQEQIKNLEAFATTDIPEILVRHDPRPGRGLSVIVIGSRLSTDQAIGILTAAAEKLRIQERDALAKHIRETQEVQEKPGETAQDAQEPAPEPDPSHDIQEAGNEE